jgi:hypothetical protein
MRDEPTYEDLSQLRSLEFQFRHAQTILDAWEQDPSYPSDIHEKAVKDLQLAADTLRSYRNRLMAGFPNHSFDS